LTVPNGSKAEVR